MASSSNDPLAPGRRAGTRLGTTRRRVALPAGRTQWLRLLIVVALGAAALLAPRQLASTGAFYTDTSTVGTDITATPSFPPQP